MKLLIMVMPRSPKDDTSYSLESGKIWLCNIEQESFRHYALDLVVPIANKKMSFHFRM